MALNLTGRRAYWVSTAFAAAFVLYGLFFHFSQEDLLQGITTAKLAGVEVYSEDKAKEETARLHIRAASMSATIAKLTARQLENSQAFNLQKDGIASTLEPFMDYAEIAAIEVTDKDNRAYASMWRGDGKNEFRVDYTMPPAFRDKYRFVVRTPAVAGDATQGFVTVYVDDQAIAEQTAALKSGLRSAADTEIAMLRDHFRRTLLPQVLVLLCGIAVVIASSRAIWLAVRRLYDPLHAALREREAGLQRAQAMAKLAHIITAPDGSFETWSETLPQLSGIPSGQIPRSTREWLRRLHPDDRGQFRARSLQAGVSRQHTEQQYRLLRPDGSAIEIRQTMEPIDPPGADGKSRWFNTLQDVTEQKRAEARIRGLNRVYAVLSGINSLIVRVNDRTELFRESCRLAVEHGHFKTAVISIVDPDGQKITLAALAGVKLDFLVPFQNGFPLQHDSPLGNTTVARVVREHRPIVSNDVRNDPEASFANECVELGIFSTAVLPLIVSGKVIGVLALLAGETDYFDDEEVKLLMELAGDISFALDHIEKADRLNYLAYYDALTGLANRSLFLERLDEKLLAARKSGSRLSVTVLGLERLQSINDAFGRPAGDQLLQQIAGRLSRLGGDAARLARIGVEAFAVVSSDVHNESEVGRTTEHELQICFDPPFRIGEQDLRIPAKAGIAMYPNDGEDAEALLRCAESALKRARIHRGRYLFFEPRMTERIAERLSLEDELRQAVERQEFVLHYQPKVDLHHRGIVGVEALIRWQSPARGLVPPAEFIPLLEETGLILQVGAWALKRAALDHRRWTGQGLNAPRIAVNVSAIQLRQKDFVSVVKEAIGGGAGQPGIDLEVTESLVIEDIAESVEKLRALRALGMGIALDDFGTGYSSLAYLARLPIEALKIDRSFIILMLKDPDTMTLVKTIISMAHSLRLKVIAEGVETEEQAAVLLQLHCDQMQGFLVSKPVAFEDMSMLLKQSANV